MAAAARDGGPGCRTGPAAGYAAICRSGTTVEVLRAYETSLAHGKAAFRRAAAASGIMPPDLPDFEWGPVAPEHVVD